MVTKSVAVVAGDCCSSVWDLSGVTGQHCTLLEFCLNVFTEFDEFNDKIYYILKRLFEPATSCVRDQDVTTVPVRHM